MTYTTNQVPGYAAVALEGPTSSLRDAQASLKLAGLSVESVGRNSILLRDVLAAALPNVELVAETYGMRVVGLYGSKTFVHRKHIPQRKAFKLNLTANKWYFAENIEETFPFVVVRDVKLEKTGDSEGDTDQILDLEFYGPNHAMPIKQTVSSREAAQYGLRPATEDDFENADMIVPVSEFSTMQLSTPSHGIPTDIPPVDEKPKPVPGQI